MPDVRILVPAALTITFLVLDRRVWTVLAEDPAAEQRAGANGLDATSRSLVAVIALAMTAFFMAKLLHRPELGLFIAIGVLIAQAIVNATLRIRAFGASSLGRDLYRRVTRIQLLSCSVTVLAYVAALAYLQRWY